jgi:DNA-binding winged helix-turn-helix (wHTH) protein
MAEPAPFILLRFEGFELDLRTRELRKDRRLVKLQDLPIRLLAMLASQPGKLITREEIEKELWGEDQFVDFEHGINTAMRKIREALEETPERPRFIETLPRKGYRFIATVEQVGIDGKPQGVSNGFPAALAASPGTTTNGGDSNLYLAPVATLTPDVPASPAAPEEFLLPRAQSRRLFLLTQAGYLATYCAMLYKAETAEEVIETVFHGPGSVLMPALVVLAMCGIAVRLYLLTSVGLDHPAIGQKYRRLFPVLFVLDAIWAATPLLLARKAGLGLTLAAVASLAYLPFVQRTLMRSSYRNNSPARP